MNSTLRIVLVGIISLVIGLFYSSQSNIDPEKQIYTVPKEPLKAFVLGATGTVGKGIVKALAEDPNFGKVTLIGRRKLELPKANPSAEMNYLKIDQKIIDFEDPSKYAKAFEGYDVGFCSLGISSAGLTNEEYYHITHDYVMDTAKLAKNGGCKHFHLVSGRSTSNTSLFYWARTKAEVEEKISKVGFDRLSIYRPGGVLKQTKDASPLGSLGIWTAKVLDPLKLMFLESTLLGKVIVRNTFREADPVETLEHGDIIKLGS